MRQAAKLKWKKTADIREDGQGAYKWVKRSVRFVRGNEEAVLWRKDATVTLVRLNAPWDFDDFVDLEEFIAEHPRDPEFDNATGELKYLREIELFAVRNGYRDELLHIQANDYAFLVAYGEHFKARYAAGEDSIVAAAFLLYVLQIYKQDRERSIRWLTPTAKDLNHAHQPQGD
jgi:hypothetical protein